MMCWMTDHEKDAITGVISRNLVFEPHCNTNGSRLVGRYIIQGLYSLLTADQYNKFKTVCYPHSVSIKAF